MSDLQTNEVTAVILAGGKGTRLGVLTNERTKPSVSFGGKYRVIDWVLTNLACTGAITDSFIMAQYEPNSLQRHIGAGRDWGFDDYDRRLHVLWPKQTQVKEGIDVWPGTVDPIREYWDRVLSRGHRAVLILAGDHVYREDYDHAVATFNARRSDAVVYCCPVAREDVPHLGTVQIDDQHRIVGFHEKPQDSEVIERLRLTAPQCQSLGLESRGEVWLASMGIYLWSAGAIQEFIDNESMVDFGRDVIPNAIEGHRIHAHIFRGFWADVGTAEGYYRTHMRALRDPRISQEVFHEDLATARLRQNPGPRIYGTVRNCVVSSGCLIGGTAAVTDSFLGYQVELASGEPGDETRVTGCILNGASRPEMLAGGKAVHPTLQVGRCVRLDTVVLDKDVTIGDGVQISPERGHGRAARAERLRGIGLREGEDFDVYDDGLLVLAKGVEIPTEFTV